ncbi:DUF58 domain-containing protein [Chitinophaga nivalis]|uniref:DUF58 domain-containing protein n=1 Tax=Chitinophaga nivalis TaxID=2991709 RepID=A0ABT3IHD2_9BACT|nr:DUF58 domain-containing protein [Chitinophaga nivalis]MCW3466932.1 DUF58 domain-containing protein [Chitinophaga nivalis]MCW3483377.1 DUF58 domain-containing protein [Chitinophaga nivalis]
MSRLLQPKTLLAIKDLSLAAKTVVAGFMSGIHASRLKGAGQEFSQYRSYQPGDDLRWLDWKMYARSDRYYIRESEMETSISVHFLVDASNSMLHEEAGITKMEYTRYLTASLGYLAHLQGDAAGLSVLHHAGLQTLLPRREAQHMARFYYQLEQIQPGGAFITPTAYRNLFTGPHTRQLLVFITDYYERNGEITTLLQTLAHSGHEVLVFHVIGEEECKGNFRGYDAVEDLETGELVMLEGGHNIDGYTKNTNEYINTLRTTLLNKGIHYRSLFLQEPLDKALRDFLNQRNKPR